MNRETQIMNERPATPEEFVTHLAKVTAAIGGQPLGRELEDRLNTEFPTGGSHLRTRLDPSIPVFSANAGKTPVIRAVGPGFQS